MIHFLTQSVQHLRALYVNRQAGVGTIQVSMAAGGEWDVRLAEDIRRKPVALVASVLPDPSSLFDLLASFRVLRENKSLNPALVIPYLAYARQDRMAAEGGSALGVMVAELLRNVNAARLFVVDPHSRIVLDALGPNASELSAIPLFAHALSEDGERPDVVVAADEGARPRAEALAALLGAEVAVIEKVRVRPSVAQAKSMEGEVAGKHAVVIDDLIDTGATMIEAVRTVSKRGATSIRVVATHGLFSREAREKLAALPIRRLYVTNTLPQPRHANITVLDITPVLLSV